MKPHVMSLRNPDNDSHQRPSDAARYRYDAAGNPVDRAELGFDVTNSFNNLNQIVTGSWTGSTVTVAGSVNYPSGSISVNGQPGSIYPDSSFDVASVPVSPGTNTLTATYVGPAFTNVPMTATDTSTVVLGDTAYTHDANGNLTGDATFTYQYDLANQLTNVICKADNTCVLSCRYDALGRRTQRVDSGLTTNVFAYNTRSELVNAVMGTNTYSYAYDPIGNRTSSSENGLITTYAANELNQYTALNPASPNPTPFTYDPDGNMTSDGTWSYSRDAENRLVEVQPLVTNLDSTLVQYMYDAQSRRIARREFAWMAFLHDDPAWRYVQDRAYRYDGWNLLQELKPATTPRTPPTYIPQTDITLTGVTGLVAAAYVWGLDLSGTLQGAGGVGGLLVQSHSATNSPWFSFCDANGNITDLLDGDGTPAARYEYDAFGNTTVQSGTQALANPFRFSSKCFDIVANLCDYGHRFYGPGLNRWLSRDSLEEVGGKNLYGYVDNNPVNHYDALGLVEGGIITIGEIPGIAEQLNALYAELLSKGVEVTGGTVEKTKIMGWLDKAGPEVFIQLFFQAIYDELQRRLEDVVRDIAVCRVVNLTALEDISADFTGEFTGDFTLKEYSFPAITQPWTWSTAPTITRFMQYEECPDRYHWHVYYHIPLSNDLKSWKTVDRFSCTDSPKCLKNW